VIVLNKRSLAELGSVRRIGRHFGVTAEPYLDDSWPLWVAPVTSMSHRTKQRNSKDGDVKKRWFAGDRNDQNGQIGD
jgi:hypothetical protein